MTEVDILGEELAASHYSWLTTTGGINFLQIGSDTIVFLLPSPEGGFYQGSVEGSHPKAAVKRLDNGGTDASTARAALETHADVTGYTYNERKASWRRTPASEPQKNLLRRLGVAVPDGMRKGQASDLLSVAKASKVLDARFAKYVTQ
jgi:hypothetical protein